MPLLLGALGKLAILLWRQEQRASPALAWTELKLSLFISVCLAWADRFHESGCRKCLALGGFQ